MHSSGKAFVQNIAKTTNVLHAVNSVLLSQLQMFASQTDSHSASTSSALWWWGFEAIEAAVLMTRSLINTQRAPAVQSPASSVQHFC